MKSYTMNESLKSAIETLKSQEMMVAHYTSPAGWWTGIIAQDDGTYRADQVWSSSYPVSMVIGMQTHDIGAYDLSDITIDQDPDHMRYMVDEVEYEDEAEAWKAWLEDRVEFLRDWEKEIEEEVENAIREGDIVVS